MAEELSVADIYEEMSANPLRDKEKKSFGAELEQSSGPIESDGIIVDPTARSETLLKIFRYIEENDQKFISSLRDAIAIRSISQLIEDRNECYRMIEFTGQKLRDLGFEVECRKIGMEEVNGEKVPFPPVILATKGNDTKKNTILIYGHLDVKPAKASDGWYCEPFYLTEEGDKLYGRGTSDNKGPIMGWIHAVESFVKQNIRLPVNIKFILESMEESESERMHDLLKSLKPTFLADVDLVAISDSQWLTKHKPCITYGLRGLSYFFCEVECGTKDLHSGVYGGVVYEAMSDLIWLLDTLTDSQGRILINELVEQVCPVTPEEEALYKNLQFDVDDFQKDCGVNSLRFPGNKTATLMHRWRYPALSIHGIQGAFGEPGAKTVIPRKVIGKFSVRLVPNMTPTKVESAVKTYLRAKWAERGSPNKMRVYMVDEGISPWCANPYHPAFKAARQATAWAYEDVPNMVREGGSMDCLVALQEATGKNVVLMPMGASDDGTHGINEKINRANYINGTKMFAAYFLEIAKLEKSVF